MCVLLLQADLLCDPVSCSVARTSAQAPCGSVYGRNLQQTCTRKNAVLELTTAAVVSEAYDGFRSQRCPDIWSTAHDYASAYGLFQNPFGQGIEVRTLSYGDNREQYMPLEGAAMWSKQYIQGLDVAAVPGIMAFVRARQSWDLFGWSQAAVLSPFVPLALVAPFSDSYDVHIMFQASGMSNSSNSTRRRLSTADPSLNMDAPWDNAFRAWLEVSPWGALTLRLSLRVANHDRIVTNSSDVTAANQVSLPACPAGSWSTLALTLRRSDNGGGAAVLTAACDATRTTSRAEVPLVTGFWHALPRRAFLLLGASGRGVGPADRRSGWFDHPGDPYEQHGLASALTGAGDIAAAAVYAETLQGPALDSVLRGMAAANRISGDLDATEGPLAEARDEACACHDGRNATKYDGVRPRMTVRTAAGAACFTFTSSCPSTALAALHVYVHSRPLTHMCPQA